MSNNSHDWYYPSKWHQYMISLDNMEPRESHHALTTHLFKWFEEEKKCDSQPDRDFRINTARSQLRHVVSIIRVSSWNLVVDGVVEVHTSVSETLIGSHPLKAQSTIAHHHSLIGNNQTGWNCAQLKPTTSMWMFKKRPNTNFDNFALLSPRCPLSNMFSIHKSYWSLR